MNIAPDALERALKFVRQMRLLPRVTIYIGENRELYGHFRKPHPRYWIIRNKVWGVALQTVAPTFAGFLRGKERNCLRTNRNKAIRAGFQLKPFDPMERLDQILEINSSSRIRQDRVMRSDYLDPAALHNFFSQKRNQCYGVFDPDGVLRAYCYAPVFGELCIFGRLLGHADFIEHGIMFLLLSETIREMIELRQRAGQPRWIMYDTFFGASDGLRYFKERMGFAPYRVRWQLGVTNSESNLHQGLDVGAVIEEPLNK